MINGCGNSSVNYTFVDHIPVIWLEPKNITNNNIVIWLPGFSGSKEDTLPQLQVLADAGFIAVSFDPYQHGERKVETKEELVLRIVGNIRRYFWPILGLTAEEFPRIIDWALDRFVFSGRVMVGGISMGGDIAVAAAGVDQRIAAVSACIATPDWLRPGSHEPPGSADICSQMCYARRNPLSNLAHYTHCPAISFQCGELDTQVPSNGAQRFIEALRGVYGFHSNRLELSLHLGSGHIFVPAMLENSIAWFNKYSI